MGFFKSTKGSIISDWFMLQQPLGQYPSGVMVDVALYDDHLVISPSAGKLEPISLPYSRITDVFYGKQSEIVEKNKSAIGRAVAGGLLFGGVGAIVGAASGTGKKQKTETKYVFIIRYTGKNGEEAFLPFDDTRMYKGSKVARQLEELCHLSPDRNVITEL